MHSKQPDKINESGQYVITCEIVSKPYDGTQADLKSHTEYYLRRSIQDYFIKFCESSIEQSDIEQFLKSKENDLIKIITVEVEFKNGLFDECKNNSQIESRIGDYVVLKRIL